jgi:hypothetical protein
MMYRPLSLFCTALVIVGCSEKSEPPSQAQPPAAAMEELPSQNDPNTTRAKLNALGIPTDYAARFDDAGKLVSIEEQRLPPGGATLDGEYFFEGARLVRYRGAKVAQPATLDLQFDMQGALLSGAGPDVTQDDIFAIRDRAQLLRSHAVAQRSARQHSAQ